MFRSSLCATIFIAMVALCYAPRADAFIFGELKQIGRAVVGTVKGVGQDVRSTGRVVKDAFTPERTPLQRYQRQYEKRMSESYREQRRQLRRSERVAKRDGTDVAASKEYEEQVKKAEKRMRKASRRSEEMTRDNKRLSKQFGASGQRPAGRMREEYRWFQQKRDARQEERRAQVGDFRTRHLNRR